MERKSTSGIVLTLLLIGMLTLASNIQLGKADWTWTETIYIRADGSVYPSSAPISTVDNVIYTLTDNIVGAVAESSSAIVVERSNIIIDGKGKTVQGTGAHLSKGISLTSMNNVTIKGTTIKGFFFGISLASSSGNCISRNNITVSNFHGVWLYYSSDNSISGNNITENNGDGIELYYSSGNNISRNNVGSHKYGIWLYSSSSNRISGNNIADSWDGIRLEYYSSDNSISGNNITANKYDGIYLESSSDNSIYHNNFIDNIDQASSYNSLNAWDDGYPSAGNYWSDYTGADEKSGPNQDQPGPPDGIGDTPYIIDADNHDRYPLVTPWIERRVGVHVGDWTKYGDFQIEYNTNDPNPPIPPTAKPYPAWIRITVLNVVDKNVSVELTTHYIDDSEETQTPTMNIETGAGYTGPIVWFISANLTAGDSVLIQAFPKINETISRVYMGTPREINHVNITLIDYYPGPYETYLSINWYWDKTTGMLTEFKYENSFVHRTEGYVTSYLMSFRVVDTNLWGAPPITSATLEVQPDTLNLRSNGKWTTAYIQLSEGYSAKDINASTILLNGTIAPVLDHKYGFVTNASGYLIDHNGDGVLERMVKLDRATLILWIYQNIGMPSSISLTITGKLLDGTSFEGTDTISVFWTGWRAPFKR